MFFNNEVINLLFVLFIAVTSTTEEWALMLMEKFLGKNLRVTHLESPEEMINKDSP